MRLFVGGEIVIFPLHMTPFRKGEENEYRNSRISNSNEKWF